MDMSVLEDAEYTVLKAWMPKAIVLVFGIPELTIPVHKTVPVSLSIAKVAEVALESRRMVAEYQVLTERVTPAVPVVKVLAVAL